MTTEERIETLQQGIQNVGERLSKFNANHITSGPKGGQFASGRGGSGGRGGGGISPKADKERIASNAGATRTFASESPRASTKMDNAEMSLNSASTALRDKKPNGSKIAEQLSSARRDVQDARQIAGNKGNTKVMAHLSVAHDSLGTARDKVISGDFKGALKAVQATNIRGVGI